MRWRDGAELAQQTVQAALVCGLPEAELEAARAGQASLPDVVWRQLGRVLRWLLVVDNADEPHEIGSARRGSRWPTIAAGSGAGGAASPDPRDQGCRPHGRVLRSRRVAPGSCRAVDHGCARGQPARARWLACGRAPRPTCRCCSTTRTRAPPHTTLNTLAQVLQKAGTFGAAGLLHERLLDVETRMLGPEHPDTLTSRNNLGKCLVRNGRAGRGNKPAPPDPGGPHPYPGPACALDGTGEHAEAVGLLRQTLNDRTRVLGPEHPHTLASRDSLGLALDGMGEHAQAVRIQRQTLEDRVRILGDEHTHTLSTHNALETALGAVRQIMRL